jgi:RNA-directed DNA polymerase
VKGVINQPSSIGGVPDRSVPHGLKLIRDAFEDGKLYYVRSDISGFFDGIPRDTVLAKMETEIDDERFFVVLRAATAVVLSNENALGEDRRLFPIDDQGVAQGSGPIAGLLLPILPALKSSPATENSCISATTAKAAMANRQPQGLACFCMR